MDTVKDRARKLLLRICVEGGRIGIMRKSSKGMRQNVKLIACAESGSMDGRPSYEPRDITAAACKLMGWRYTEAGYAQVNYWQEAVHDLARELYKRDRALEVVLL